MSNPYCMNEFARQMGAVALRNADFALAHVEDFVKIKQMLKAVTGKNLIMAETDDRVPICMLSHVDPEVKLAKVLAEAGVIAVDASEFDTIGVSAVRLRVPSIDKMEKVCASVAKVNEE
jgi:histidinol-phosphate aminotransferase